MALITVVAVGFIGVAIASPETIRSALKPASSLPGTDTPAPTHQPGITPTRSTTRTATTTPTVVPVPSGEQALSGNPMLQAGGMTKQVCSPPGWPSDGASGEAFYAAALPCVARAWQPLFERARMEYDTPKVMVPAGTTATSPCGTVSTEDAAAFYCSTNETIYMPIAGLPVEWTEGEPLNYFSVFAHEFGHHVQELTGSLDEAHRRERRVGGDTPAGLELNRRTELQAQCFAGIFIESIVDSGGPFNRGDFESTRQFEHISDSPTHGTADNSQGWWLRGAQNQVAQCNTWSASAAEVA